MLYLLHTSQESYWLHIWSTYQGGTTSTHGSRPHFVTVTIYLMSHFACDQSDSWDIVMLVLSRCCNACSAILPLKSQTWGLFMWQFLRAEGVDIEAGRVHESRGNVAFSVWVWQCFIGFNIAFKGPEICCLRLPESRLLLSPDITLPSSCHHSGFVHSGCRISEREACKSYIDITRDFGLFCCCNDPKPKPNQKKLLLAYIIGLVGRDGFLSEHRWPVSCRVVKLPC